MELNSNIDFAKSLKFIEGKLRIFVLLMLILLLVGCATKDKTGYWESDSNSVKKTSQDLRECKLNGKKVTDVVVEEGGGHNRYYGGNRVLEEPNKIRQRRKFLSLFIERCMKDRGYKKIEIQVG